MGYKNHPVVSTAKVRGLIKKNGINYVDATRRYHPTIAVGVNVWQLCDSVYFQVFGYGSESKENEIYQKFVGVLANEGLAVHKGSHGVYEIVLG